MPTADSSQHVNPVTSWIGTIFVGAIICGLIGPAIGLIAFIPFAGVSRLSAHDTLTTLASFPIWWVFAIIPMGPVGSIFGGLGASWIRFRSRTLHASGRLLFESTSLGTVLGAAAPIVALAGGWGPHQNILRLIPVGAVSGLICGALVERALRKLHLLFVHTAQAN
jgi:hypothetical protein